MNPKVDSYFLRITQWRQESEKLRAILLGCPLTEELKWGQPCYTFGGKNIVLIGGFKDYCSLLFVKGVLMADPNKLLVGTGRTQVGRMLRFTSLGQIVSMEAVIKTYIYEAIRVEKSGLKAKLKDHSEYIVPEELQSKLDQVPALKTAFERLTPGRQRGYILHISAAKQARTREARVEKCIAGIMDGKGFNE